MRHRASLMGIVTALTLVAPGGIAAAQVRDANMRDAAAEAEAKQALETFITEWNTADDANLRGALNFPFVTVQGAGRWSSTTGPKTSRRASIRCGLWGGTAAPSISTPTP